MALKRRIATDRAPQPAGPYSQGIQVGNRIYVAGQRPADPVTGRIVGDTVEEQTRQVLLNIQAVLEAAGARLDDVVKSTVHLADLGDFDAFNRVYETFFTEPYPVRTTVQSVLRGIKVEMDVIAEVDGPADGA
ncbi:MAG: Rid family detoxifying hydrolase [Alicyclobacillus sp.]|nr:Rid family detoxifying hydrolase [Alicyclobacillus sp.]